MISKELFRSPEQTGGELNSADSGNVLYTAAKLLPQGGHQRQF